MDAQGYPEPPAVGSEAEALVGSLERQRATFAWKCEGLDGHGLSQRLGPSTLTLGRLLKHLAYMEDLNFHAGLARQELPEPWSAAGAAGRSDWVFQSADTDSPEVLHALWAAAVDRSRAAVLAALAVGGLGSTYAVGSGRESSVRRLMVDMIEEYARHTGQADLLREAVDGRVGEDPPGPAYDFTLGSPTVSPVSLAVVAPATDDHEMPAHPGYAQVSVDGPDEAVRREQEAVDRIEARAAADAAVGGSPPPEHATALADDLPDEGADQVEEISSRIASLPID